MKHLLAALTLTSLVFAGAAAQDEHGRDAQQHGNPPGHGPGPERGPQIGGPNRHDPPGFRPDLGRVQGHTDPDRPGAGPHGFGHRDFGSIHGNFHAERRFHAAPWHPPRDYQYRRWTYGERLPSLYFAPGLWITSFGLYGLMAPPPDTVWVRNGPDALLVDRDSGEIIRVQYDVFY